jgi:hypothetical protein
VKEERRVYHIFSKRDSGDTFLPPPKESLEEGEPREDVR